MARVTRAASSSQGGGARHARPRRWLACGVAHVTLVSPCGPSAGVCFASPMRGMVGGVARVTRTASREPMKERASPVQVERRARSSRQTAGAPRAGVRLARETVRAVAGVTGTAPG